MHRFCLALIVSLLLAAASFGQPVLTKQDYTIYSVVLEDIREIWKSWDKNERSEPHFLLYHETFRPESDWRGGYPERKGLTADFIKKNKDQASFEGKLSVNYPYSVISESELAALLKKGEEFERLVRQQHDERYGGRIGLRNSCGTTWTYIYETFPRSGGYYRFSRVGYSWDGRWALVETKGKGGCWDANWTHLLKWTKSGWKVHQAGAGLGIA